MSANAKVNFGIDFAYSFLDAYMPISNYCESSLPLSDCFKLLKNHSHDASFSESATPNSSEKIELLASKAQVDSKIPLYLAFKANPLTIIMGR